MNTNRSVTNNLFNSLRELGLVSDINNDLSAENEVDLSLIVEMMMLDESLSNNMRFEMADVLCGLGNKKH